MKLITIMKRTNIKLGILAICLAFTANCVSTMGMTSSTTPLEGKNYEIVGKAKGESNYSGTVLGLWGIGRADMDKAIADAVKKQKGDAMINVRWYNKTYYFILFSLDKVFVEGDVIKFKNSRSRWNKGGR